MVRLGIRGVHNVSNALAAAAVGLGLDVPLERVAAALGEAGSSPWRMDLRTTGSGLRVLNDAYNAGPASMAAALRSIAALPVDDDGGRRIAVVGLMAELGDDAPREHHDIATIAHDLGIELVAVGTDLYGIEPLPDVAAVLDRLGEMDLGEGDVVLVKGSRVAGLERVAEALLD
jgi:UDP-N-acetylmuramoyl-tripeptide--D-alanyl-D-alanine ligase